MKHQECETATETTTAVARIEYQDGRVEEQTFQSIFEAETWMIQQMPRGMCWEVNQ